MHKIERFFALFTTPLMLAPTAAGAITPDWEASFIPDSIELVIDVATDSTGATFVTQTVETGPGPADVDIGLTRINPDGTLAWERLFAGPVGQDIAAAVSMSWDYSAVYVLGRSSVPGFGNSDFTILKYDAVTGDLIWSRFYDGGNMGIDSPRDIAGTPDGGVAATGGIDTPNEQRDFGTVKLDADGNVLWEQGFSGQGPFLFENDDATFIAVCDNGDVVITGNAAAGSSTDIVTIKYAGQTGATVWEARYGSPSTEVARGLAIAPDGDVVLFGRDPGGIDHRWMLASYDGLSGVEQWVRLVDPGQDESQAHVVIDQNGTVYATGATDPDFDDSNANQNAITIAVDGESGALLWLNEFGDEGIGDADFGSRLHHDGAGHLYVFGSTASASLVSGPFDSDAIVLKLDDTNGLILDMGLIDTSTGGTTRSEVFRHLGVDNHGGMYAVGSAQGGEFAPVELLVARFEADVCPADLAEPFGVLDLADIQVFIAGFVAQVPIADLNNDGIFDLTDVQVFVASFTAGCP